MVDELDQVFEDLEHYGEEAATGHSALRPMVLSLIQSSYLHTRTLTDFSRDVVDIVTSAVSVPWAFAEGFLRTFLSIDSVREDESGRVIIRPKAGADERDLIRDVDEFTARLEPDAVYNPVIRKNMDLVAEATSIVMQQDLQALGELGPEDLRRALEELEAGDLNEEAQEEALMEAERVRRRIEDMRSAIRRYQADIAGPNGGRESA